MTTQVTTFSDLYTDLLRRVRDDTTQTSNTNEAKKYINTALQDMHIHRHHKVPWAERTGYITTRPTYTTGTGSLNVTIGSRTVTNASAAWNTADSFSVTNARTGGKMKIGGQTEVYSVAYVTDDNTIGLNIAWQGATATDASYTYFEDEFELASDFMRLVDANNFSDDVQIRMVGRQTFRRRVRNNTSFGNPSIATIFDDDFRDETAAATYSGSTSHRVRVQLFPAPDARKVIPYQYITRNLAVDSNGAPLQNLSSDTDEPIVYFRYRHAIVLNALYHYYRDRKDDRRWQAVKQDYDEVMARLIEEYPIADDRPRIRTDRQVYRAKSRRPYRRGGYSRRHVTGSAFDRMD